MENSNQLANRLREVLLSGKWIANTNYKEQCSSVSWEQATKKVNTLNTIAALTFHMNYYLDGILNVFEGGTLDIRDKFSFDMPPILSKKDWESLLNELIVNAEKFANHVDQMTEEKLTESFVDEKYGSYRRNIEAVIEHAYYHLGQISLIKKMVLESEN